MNIEGADLVSNNPLSDRTESVPVNTKDARAAFDIDFIKPSAVLLELKIRLLFDIRLFRHLFGRQQYPKLCASLISETP